MILRKITTAVFVVQIVSSMLFAQNKIGFVQSDRIRAESEEFIDAESQLQLEYRQVNIQYNSMIVELDSIKQSFETQRLMSSPEWRKEKEAESQKPGADRKTCSHCPGANSECIKKRQCQNVNSRILFENNRVSGRCAQIYQKKHSKSYT